jgi:octaheme c-type cytochrome (tetrathionate reductase family)
MNIQSNEARCTSCHAGYGWKDKSFDFSDPVKVDCLVCHEQTGTYKKFPTMAGYPVEKPKKFAGKKQFYPPDYKAVSQSVGRPGRKNCGTCHFYGGGGDGVKHGDLDSSLFTPTKNLDVHMGVDGQNFTCVRCHTTTLHDIAGRIYSNPAATERKSLLEDDLLPKIMCESCHSATPHKAGHKANDHTDKVACQACHIPAFARENPTKMSWDWSTAGKMKDGKPYTEKGPLGKASYVTKKGSFVWGTNVVPEYYWYNGVIESLRVTDTIDPSGVVKLSWPEGDKDDPRSRIMPFKVHRGKTPYDKGHNTMVVPHLFGKDDTAYWKHFDWAKAIQAGMDYVGLDYSGEYGFVDTEWVFPTTHMVAPKEQSLACSECHSRQGRLANLAGFYMPGRDHNQAVDWIGWAAALASLVGVGIHGFIRLVSRKRWANGEPKE